MQLPTIHLGGSHAPTLYEDNRAAADAIRTAITHLAEAGPNARDYYPQGPQAFSLASDEHLVRMNALRSILRDLDAIAEHIVNTGEL